MAAQTRIEQMKKRHSVRNFKSDVSTEILAALREKLAELPKGLFGNDVRLEILENSLDGSGQKLGTYGVIKGAKHYLVSAIKGNGRALCDLGYVMEHAILDAVSLGLGTCWLGGTFAHSSFARAMNLQDGEQIVIVSPLGIEDTTPRFIDRAMKWFANSAQRKSFDKILSVDEGCEHDARFNTAIEMVRCAPSALNAQPWQIIKKSDGYYFAVQPSRLEGKKFAMVDMGIALAHFEMAAKELGLPGSFKPLEESSQKPDLIAVWNLEG